MDINTVLFAFLLTLIAGLSTGIGSAIAFFTKKTNTIFLSATLGLSAGVMVYVSFVEMYPKAILHISNSYNNDTAILYATLAFFAGILVALLIDKLVPTGENPHEIRTVEDMSDVNMSQIDSAKLYRLGLMSAIAITIHNFPEGIATFVAALSNPALGVSIALAVAIHNIPEGIAVSVPIYYSTGSKIKAFKFSFLSGLAEPLGAIIAFLILMPFLNDLILGIVFAFVAGIMIFISIDELLPAAHRYGKHHVAIYGFIIGMAIMAFSLILV